MTAMASRVNRVAEPAGPSLPAVGQVPSVVVRYSRTGGFMPEARSCALDTALLPQGTADRLAELVGRSGILDGQVPVVPAAPAAPIVTLEVSAGDRVVTASCPLPLLSPPLAELVRFVDAFCDGGDARSGT
jgi:hypothetical protein